SGHAVEIGVVTGEVCEPLLAHDSNHQRIAAEQAVLLAEGGRRGHEGRRDRHHVNAEGRDVVDDFAKARQLAKLIRVSLQALRNTGYRPTKSINGLQGHDPVGDIGQHVCRRVSPQFLGGSAFQEMLTWDLKRRVWWEMVNEEIRVQKYRYVGGNVGQCKGHSSTPNSGSKAMRSTVSASPFQPSKPAVARTRLTAVWTVIWTFSCSASGSGRSGFSMPFSYVASTTMDIVRLPNVIKYSHWFIPQPAGKTQDRNPKSRI